MLGRKFLSSADRVRHVVDGLGATAITGGETVLEGPHEVGVDGCERLLWAVLAVVDPGPAASQDQHKPQRESGCDDPSRFILKFLSL
jgi:hypothetical protein